jgi:putative SOS response-associated peptidase YedK
MISFMFFACPADASFGECTMCGRFTLYANPRAVATFVQAPEPTFDWEPRYNIAPTQDVVSFLLNPLGVREIVEMRWGLIPSWAKDASAGYKAINARAETITEKPFFRSAFKKRRCLIPASGFYEWKTKGKKKQPYLIRQGELFAFAGLWETWNLEPITSCTIITTAAGEAMQGLHERMPVILPPESFGAWLDPLTPQEQLLEMLRPADSLSITPVGAEVGNVKNQGPGLIAPAADLFSA